MKAYMSNSNASDKVNVSVRLNQMHLRHDTTHIASESGQNLDGAESKQNLKSWTSLS